VAGGGLPYGYGQPIDTTTTENNTNSVNITINGITFDGSAGLDTSLKDLLLQCGPEARNTLDAIDSRVR
jgi:hypothetical protein